MLTKRDVMRFCNALLAVEPRPLPIFRPRIIGYPGIRATTRIDNNKGKSQLLGRHHEYIFRLPDGKLLELSLQLNLDGDNWRLFAYSVVDGKGTPGMLLSLNLSRSYDGSPNLPLRQKLKSSTRGLDEGGGKRAMESLAAQVRSLGLRVTDDRDLVFGLFDIKNGVFVGTTASRFIEEFVTTAVLKGHYMRNKGYDLPPLDAVAIPTRSKEGAASRRNQGGALPFDPYNMEDARQRAMADVVRRPGQSAFRDAVLTAYGEKCAVTGCDFVGTLAAAHITPHLGAHTDHVQNGLLLRADIHVLFDRGLIAIDSKTMKVRLADSLLTTVYREYADRRILLPRARDLQPNRQALDKHRLGAGL